MLQELLVLVKLHLFLNYKIILKVFKKNQLNIGEIGQNYIYKIQKLKNGKEKIDWKNQEKIDWKNQKKIDWINLIIHFYFNYVF